MAAPVALAALGFPNLPMAGSELTHPAPDRDPVSQSTDRTDPEGDVPKPEQRRELQPVAELHALVCSLVGGRSGDGRVTSLSRI